ncbi:hypothetical protein HDU97_001375 [Phlyctochytrium planicorne]|nr:hypothetical protein HDU97_001375 [Phlyctochytrium planicorne]
MYIFLIHALTEGVASVLNIVGLLTGGTASVMFPGATDPHGKLAAEVCSYALVTFATIPYISAFFFPPPKASSIPLGIAAALYHYALVAQTIFRLISPDIPPIVGPDPNDPAQAYLGNPDDARRLLGLIAAAVHIVLGSMFISIVVEEADKDESLPKGGAKGEVKRLLKDDENENEDEDD